MPRGRAARQSRRAEYAGARGHRARQHVLGRGVSRRSQETRHQPDSRLRGLRGARRSHGSIRHAGGDRQSSGAACGDRRGVPQPHQAGVIGLHRRLLLQAAYRQAAACGARQGPDRAEQLPQRRGRNRNPDRSDEAGARGRGDVQRDPRARQFFPGDAGSGHRGAAYRQQRAAAARARAEPPARLHERRALPQADRSTSARRAVVHRDRQERQRRKAPEVPRRPVLPEDGGADGGCLRRVAGGHGQHGADRRALQREDPFRRSAPA